MNFSYKNVVKLKRKRYATEAGFVLVEGKRTIKQIIQDRVVIYKLFADDMEKLEPLLKSSYVKNFSLLTKSKLTTLSQTKQNQGLVGVVKSKTKSIGKDDFVLYLDGISDPGNLGTIIRTSLALGVDGIALSPDCCWVFNPKTIRSSLGAVFKLPIELWDYKMLANRNAQIVQSRAIEGAIEVNQFKRQPNRKMVLVLGSEAKGTSEEIQNIATTTLCIPMKKGVESLNVASAASILVYSILNS